MFLVGMTTSPLKKLLPRIKAAFWLKVSYLAHVFSEWAFRRHSKVTAESWVIEVPHSYTLRMRSYYGKRGLPIPNNSITQIQMERELHGS